MVQQQRHAMQKQRFSPSIAATLATAMAPRCSSPVQLYEACYAPLVYGTKVPINLSQNMTYCAKFVFGFLWCIS